MSPVEAIRIRGDLLERAAFADGQFADCFADYAKIWSWLRRVDQGAGGGLGQWEGFARSHYSAIERAWAAWRQRLRLQVVDGMSPSVVLSIAGLWVHANSAMAMLVEAATCLERDVLVGGASGSLRAAARWEAERDGVDPRTADECLVGHQVAECWNTFLSCAQEAWCELVNRCSPLLHTE